MVNDPFFYLIAGACLLVVAILMMGIATFTKGGDFNRKHGNRLMRYRIYAQAVAVALIVIFALLRHGGGS